MKGQHMTVETFETAPEAPAENIESPNEELVETTEGAPAKVATGGRDKQAVPEDVAQNIADRLVDLRDKHGWSRNGIQAAVPAVNETIKAEAEDEDDPTFLDPENFTSAKIWRMEQGNVHTDEVELVHRLLDALENGKVNRPAKATGGRGRTSQGVNAKVRELELERDVLKDTLRDVLETLGEVRGGGSNAKLKEAIATALRAIEGDLSNVDGQTENVEV